MKIIFSFFIGASMFAHAQQDRKVLATSGRVAKNLNQSLFQTRRIEYTLGEPFTITSLSNGKRINSGFNQPDVNLPISNPSGGATNSSALNAIVFPNPTDHYLSIQTNFAPDTQYDIQLIDLNGKLISIYHMNSNQLRINDLSLPSGLYLLNFYDSYGKFLLQKELTIF
jgi:hypothetical protein